MHQGNLFVDKKGIIPVDFGIMGRLDKNNEGLAETFMVLFKEIMLKLRKFILKLVLSSRSLERRVCTSFKISGRAFFGQSIKDILEEIY